MSDEVKITSIRETMGLDEKRMPTPYIAVTFTVGEHGPFVHQFKKAEFRADTVRVHLAQFAAEITRLTG